MLLLLRFLNEQKTCNINLKRLTDIERKNMHFCFRGKEKYTYIRKLIVFLKAVTINKINEW